MPCWRRASAIARGYDDMLVMFGDTPLIEAEALLGRAREAGRGRRRRRRSASAPPIPTGYGRLIEKDGRLVAIREEKDCIEAENARSTSAMAA